MIARAPGKIVVSGAYSVLEGAPALVAAVDRYVIADAARPADLVTSEVREAIAAGVIDTAPWFDASALRESLGGGESRKLGLGSSAAILVASIGAVVSARGARDERALRDEVLGPALAAHRAAQGGGSGVDVAAAVHGGVIACTLGAASALEVHAHALPEGTVIEIFGSPVSASTRDLLALVRAFAGRDPAGHRAHLARAGAGGRAALAATTPQALAAALIEQIEALGELGRLAGAPIVTPEVGGLAALAAADSAAFGPSGAGGGDIAIHVSGAPSSAAFRARAEAAGLTLLPIRAGARGLHVVSA